MKANKGTRPQLQYFFDICKYNLLFVFILNSEIYTPPIILNTPHHIKHRYHIKHTPLY